MHRHLDVSLDGRTPWRALRYLVSDATYGGRVTDELDRRILSTCSRHLFREAALDPAGFFAAATPGFGAPPDGSLASQRAFIAALPASDPPEVLGQHRNAEVGYQVQMGAVLSDGLLSLQGCALGAGGGGGGGSSGGGSNGYGGHYERLVVNLAEELLDTIPQPFDVEEVAQAKASDPSALNAVLVQELNSCNALLARVRRDCVQLQRGLKGLVVMSAGEQGRLGVRLHKLTPTLFAMNHVVCFAA